MESRVCLLHAAAKLKGWLNAGFWKSKWRTQRDKEIRWAFFSSLSLAFCPGLKWENKANSHGLIMRIDRESVKRTLLEGRSIFTRRSLLSQTGQLKAALHFTLGCRRQEAGSLITQKICDFRGNRDFTMTFTAFGVCCNMQGIKIKTLSAHILWKNFLFNRRVLWFPQWQNRNHRNCQ